MRLWILSKALQTNFFLLLYEIQSNTFVSILCVKFTVWLQCCMFLSMPPTEKWPSQKFLFASEVSKHPQFQREKKIFCEDMSLLHKIHHCRCVSIHILKHSSLQSLRRSYSRQPWFHPTEKNKAFHGDCWDLKTSWSNAVSHSNSAYFSDSTHLKNINSTKFKMLKLFLKWVFNFYFFKC